MSTYGKDFTPPCVPGKVTGEIKYAEDYKAEGMVFARLLTSPMPSGRVVNIDASAALRMDGVIGIFTADDLHLSRPGQSGSGVGLHYLCRSTDSGSGATSEEIAETALDRIRIDFERRDFVVDLWRVSPMVRMPIPKATRW